ncbi:YitT family protein [Desulfosediminicola flagellatus]|uniref:YitT family protein n=1 Tax=Desulfosediminicola flagellatus TaxID=2569541 RepID=UPI0010AC5ADC|nr:YitT family protein [Desulfosediminicola flagellatus]
MGSKLNDLKYSVAWNLVLLTVGSLIYIVGMNGIVVHHNFIPGGLYGLCLFIFYKTDLLSPGIWYLVLNVPLLILGWIYVSRRFILYTIYSVLLITVASELITVDLGITDQLYAAIAGGAIIGTGSGVLLRSIGSAGGLDVIAIILNRYFNLGIGKTFMLFNMLLFSLVISQYGADIFIASVILTAVTSTSLNYCLTMFNQRKIVYVISEKSQQISDSISDTLKLGSTLIQGRGAYSGQDKEILMTITNNILLKRLEEAVFTIDEDALFIVENSYDVIGSNFNKRKIY